MPDSVLEFTSMIVSSFVAKNRTSGSDLSQLIATVHTALADAAAPPPEPAAKQEAAVTLRRSVTPDALICMDCGKTFKSLKRHLQNDHDLSPEGYRAKWNLPKTYPMTAPAYSATRSALAKSVGLGFRRQAAGGADAPQEPVSMTEPELALASEPAPSAASEPLASAAVQAPTVTTRAKRAPKITAEPSKQPAAKKTPTSRASKPADK